MSRVSPKVLALLAALAPPLLASFHDVRMFLGGDGVEAVNMTPAEFGTYLHNEIVKWGKVVKISGATVD